jgi:hypothetical protein
VNATPAERTPGDGEIATGRTVELKVRSIDERTIAIDTSDARWRWLRDYEEHQWEAVLTDAACTTSSPLAQLIAQTGVERSTVEVWIDELG